MLAMQALYQDYSTKDSAFLAIKSQITDYYSSNLPEIFQNRDKDINDAVTEIQNGYSNNIFPLMKASWKAYPNNIGHMEVDGCFRCHNDRHATQSGKLISKDCNLCHSITAQGSTNNLEYSVSSESLEFKHPIDIGDAWKTEFCSSCHSALY